jgi:predicted TIM-barrel fold metal-dependent hydrolase
MIVDSHCHAWTTWPYDTSVPDPQSRGRIEQLLFEMDRNGVDRAVLICARIDHNPDNNEYVAAEAARHPDRVVQFPDVDCSWSPEYHTPGAPDRLAAAADRWGVSGFTHYLGETDDGWLTSDEGMAFFGVAAERNLIASIATSPAWFDGIAAVAAAHPTLPILLHHQGLVRAADGPEPPGLRALEALATHPNIAVKASGFYYGSRDVVEYPYPDQVALFERIYAAFGAQRLAWGSDYPVAPWVASTYAQTLAVVRRHCPFIDEASMAWVLGDTMAALLQTRRPLVGNASPVAGS